MNQAPQASETRNAAALVSETKPLAIDNVNKARALHKYSFLKLQNNEKNKIDPTLMLLHWKRKIKKKDKMGRGEGFLRKNMSKSGHQL